MRSKSFLTVPVQVLIGPPLLLTTEFSKEQWARKNALTNEEMFCDGIVSGIYARVNAIMCDFIRSADA